MFEEWSKWYQLLSTSKSFKRARILAVVLGLELAGLGYASLTGHPLEWLSILFVPIWLTFVSFREQLSLAYLVANERRRLARVQELAQYSAAQQEDEDTEEDAPDEQAEELFAYPQNYELSEENQLVLCQYYVFLYCLFELRKSGEASFNRMLGMPEGRYREWLRLLAKSELGLVESSPGKTRIARVSFEEVLYRLEVRDGKPGIWEFPRRVYQDRRNWKNYDPNAPLVADGSRGKSVVIRVRKYRNRTPFPLPIYPQRLTDLKLEFNF
jgi:hypothetical protein